ncbi:iron ABC transporter permease [Nocardioides sp. cx-173]|uniref:FecCD family ABC transporter permease n=1 Tax=Nocardioides sp. cx-173 TaxID=2898796 RepID=UPI001E4B7AE6|nr:iron ABC transporter permease [Nocardioides sp. cx-173]MCD4524697.1 iron ABC transporter permease [Nocardioides sp. cx-173]UGB43207.1 iron ABC transporter permease [Nocardioides sp. cx-173]
MSVLVPARPPAASGRPRTAVRGLLAVAVLLLLLAVVALASLMWGVRDIPAGQVWDALVSPVAGDNDHGVVRTERVPRTLIGLMGGAALGAAGALMQGVTRNPIADPGLLGLNSGASLAVIVAIAGFHVTSVDGYVWFAFLGAAVAAVIVYGAASVGWEGVTPVKLALVGAAVTATATSLITLVLLTDRHTLQEYRFWQVGSLANRSLDALASVLPFVGVGLLLALAAGRVLNALALGDDVARGLGQDVVRGRLLVVLAVVLLCGSAVSLVGPIAFVGLVVPHVARVVVGPDYRWLVVLSILIGPLLLLVADIVGRLLVPGELEAGLVVALVGTPVLLVLVRRSRSVAA